MQSLMLRSFPRAILHIDGDSFFASCEVARNPALKGKPVVTGRERGIASSMSYEAKARGITRGMQLHTIRKICPDVVIIPSDYESYSLYSKRMYEIVRRYTPDVDEYSIDECFADITGLKKPLNMSYGEIAESIKKDLGNELGMTFSVGLSVNKVTAKLASKWKKPDGLTIMPGHLLHEFYIKSDVSSVWGIGPNTSEYLYKLGIKTILDLVLKDEEFIKNKLTKPTLEIWRELKGEFVYQLNTSEKQDYKSVSKTRTFTPPSTDREFVYSQLSKNVENACIKLRRHGLFTQDIAFFLKAQDFRHYGIELKLSSPVSVPQEIMRVINKHFDDIFTPGVTYRATGIVLMKLSADPPKTMDLFGAIANVENMKHIYDAVDKVAERYGKHTLYLGSSFLAMKNHQHEGDRGNQVDRKQTLLKGETARKKLGIPFLGKTK